MATPPNVYGDLDARLRGLEETIQRHGQFLELILDRLQRVEIDNVTIRKELRELAEQLQEAAQLREQRQAIVQLRIQQQACEEACKAVERRSRITEIDCQEAVQCRNCPHTTRRTLNGKCQVCKGSVFGDGDVAPVCEYPGCQQPLARGLQMLIFWNSDERWSTPCRECLGHICNPCWEKHKAKKILRGTFVDVCGECKKGNCVMKRSNTSAVAAANAPTDNSAA